NRQGHDWTHRRTGVNSLSEEVCLFTRGCSPLRVCASVRLARSDSAGLKHRRMVTALQQVVQHLVLHELAVVAPAVREEDGVRRTPPSIAAALIGGTGIIRTRHLVPVHALELGPETRALLSRPTTSGTRR